MSILKLPYIISLFIYYNYTNWVEGICISDNLSAIHKIFLNKDMLQLRQKLCPADEQSKAPTNSVLYHLQIWE